MALASVSTVVSAAADSRMPTSNFASACRDLARVGRQVHLHAQTLRRQILALAAALGPVDDRSASRMAASNSSFAGPMVAHTMLPKAYMCSRPSCGMPSRSGSTL